MNNLQLFEMARYPSVFEKNHESLFLSYHILCLVKDLLNEGTPAKVVLQVVAELEGAPEPSGEAAI